MAHLERGWTGRIMDVDFQVDVARPEHMTSHPKIPVKVGQRRQ